MDDFHEVNAQFTRLMIRETLTRKEVAWLNDHNHGARILPGRKIVLVDGFRTFKLR